MSAVWPDEDVRTARIFPTEPAPPICAILRPVCAAVSVGMKNANSNSSWPVAQSCLWTTDHLANTLTHSWVFCLERAPA